MNWSWRELIQTLEEKKLNILHIQALNDTITLKIMKFMHKLAAPEKLFIIHPFGAGICEQIELKPQPSRFVKFKKSNEGDGISNSQLLIRL